MQSNSEGNHVNKSVITNRWHSSLSLEHLRGAHFTLDKHTAQGGGWQGSWETRGWGHSHSRHDGHDITGTTRMGWDMLVSWETGSPEG